MLSLQFARSEHDSCVYVKEVNPGEFVYLLLYVDDMLLAAKSKSEISKLKEALSLKFEMKDMGAASRILGIDIIRNRKEGTLRLSQTRYVDKVIQRFRMADAKVVSTPMGAHFKLTSLIDEIGSVDPEVVPYSSAVGSVMYAMIGTIPDVAYAMGLVSRFMSRPGEMHWEAVKWLLRYLKGSRDLNLVLTKGANLEVQGYCDSDHAADLDKRRSISGYVFTVGG
ncbi:putative RNA-directed DNA polymerase [Arabidopsis thaliana]